MNNAILFDLDGTLVDTADDILDAINNLCIKYNFSIPDQKSLKNNTSFGLKKLLSRALNIEFEETNQEELFNFYKISFIDFYHKTNFEKSVLFPGIQELLDNLKKYNFQIAVVTNKHSQFANLILKKLNLLKYLNCVITADMVKKPKPAPDPVLLAINELKTSPDRCIFIGDAKQDIIAGNLAGVRTVSALFGYVDDSMEPSNWGANYSVIHAKELWPLVEKLYTIKN